MGGGAQALGFGGGGPTGSPWNNPLGKGAAEGGGGRGGGRGGWGPTKGVTGSRVSALGQGPSTSASVVMAALRGGAVEQAKLQEGRGARSVKWRHWGLAGPQLQ